jgi:hypothetical protein
VSYIESGDSEDVIISDEEEEEEPKSRPRKVTWATSDHIMRGSTASTPRSY